jgi:hypothetical protein
MKKSLLLAATLLTAGSASAQSGGYYEFIPYYNNDPFVFCAVGVPQDCWAPISPQLGTFTVTNPYCFNPTSATQFARVCPKAFSGGASGSGGRQGRGAGGATQRSMSSDPANASP